MNFLNIILNGNLVEGHEGETIFDLAARHGLEIPTLCHDNRLEPFSSCYVCVVQVAGMRGLQPSCSTRIAEGMKIDTHNEKVRKSRKMALELLVSNHYADCVAPCRQTCPAGVDVQGYISMISKGLYREAVQIIKDTNPLPAICGRVCVRPCELACRRNLLDEESVGIDYLKRYAADIDLDSNDRFVPHKKPTTGKKVAVIGAGPAGLSAAFFLAKEGHQVAIFEASDAPGGMLRYGIPEYRLPNNIIDKEIEGITDLGVTIEYAKRLGNNLLYKDIKTQFDALVLAIGSQAGTRIGCENDNAKNIFSGIDFLRNMEVTGEKYNLSGKRVGVIGGGNTAMDCCRTAIRCGASEVTVIYRRTEKEMPANPIEIHESKIEGVHYRFLTAPARVNTNSNGELESLTCFRMELGEPDASGRQRPIKVEGSEFDIPLDIILAAIGQKTVVDFIDDINQHSDIPLELNKWGDIAADPETLRTSIPNTFACGDSVTGPATLIEAIAQGKKAALGCHLYLEKLPPTALQKEFLSKRDNFQKQLPKDYKGLYQSLYHEPMPVLSANERNNFHEVELGYSAPNAMHEAARCMECGCGALYSCKLKEYATQYQASQNRFDGTFANHTVKFDHPLIEIDNNKCILCSRCIRICNELAGANALGLINRGFNTYVAPALELPLAETPCESCGLCIDTCPTGAISENVPFKLAAVPLDTFHTICTACSIGCQVVLHHKGGFFVKATGTIGKGNPDGSICRFAKFGYRLWNKSERITKPLMRKENKLVEVTFEEAFEKIREKISTSKPDQNSFFIGGNVTNENALLIKKFAQSVVKSKNISSFYNWHQHSDVKFHKHANASIENLQSVKNVYLVASELNLEHAVLGFAINALQVKQKLKLHIVTTLENSAMERKANAVIRIKNYQYFLLAANHLALSHNMVDTEYLSLNALGVEEYKKDLLSENLESLMQQAGCNYSELFEFVQNNFLNSDSIILYSESCLGSEELREINNFANLCRKSENTKSRLICLSEILNAKGVGSIIGNQAIGNNSQPLNLGQIDYNGCEAYSDELSQKALLEAGAIANAFIFGEDPIGCANDKQSVKELFAKLDFLVVNDCFLTETAKMADVVLPAQLPFEQSGNFVNYQNQELSVIASHPSPVEMSMQEQIYALAAKLDMDFTILSHAELSHEANNLIQGKSKESAPIYKFILSSPEKNILPQFSHGCDYFKKYLQEFFHQQLTQTNSHEIVQQH